MALLAHSLSVEFACSSIQSMPNILLTFSTTMEYGTMQINEKAFCNL